MILGLFIDTKEYFYLDGSALPGREEKQKMTETKDQVEAAPAAEEVKAETAVAEPAKEEAVKVEPNPLERKVEVSVSRADIEKKFRSA